MMDDSLTILHVDMDAFYASVEQRDWAVSRRGVAQFFQARKSMVVAHSRPYNF